MGLRGQRMPHSFFASLGEVSFRVVWLPGGQASRRVEKEVTVATVAPTSKGDVEALRELRLNNGLLNCTVEPGVVHYGADIGLLREVIERHSGSTYADYWRIAAATILAGEGCSLLRDDDGQIRRVMEQRLASPHRREMLEAMQVHPARAESMVRKFRADVIRRYVDAGGNTRAKEKAVDECVAIALATRDDVDEAVRYLRAVSERCALSPLATVMLCRIASADPSRTELARYKEILETTYSNTFEAERERRCNE